MGKGGKEVTIGHQYFIGQHVVLCQYPIDGVMALKFKDREAWRGFAMDARINVSKPDIFGGKYKEGGVSGYVDVLGGGPEQGVNDYLNQQLDGLVPAFRGVVSLVFRQFYWGNNPTKWQAYELQAQNVFSTFQGWLPALAPINPDLSSSNGAIYIAIDDSGSMGTGSRLSTMKDGVKSFLRTLPFNSNTAVRLVRFAATVKGAVEYLEWDEASLANAEAFLDTFSPNTGTDFAEAAASAPGFFDRVDSANDPDRGRANSFRSALTNAFASLGLSTNPEPVSRSVVFITDGEPTSGLQTAINTLASIDRLQTFGVNIELSDTSATDQLSDFPVPVITDGDVLSLGAALGARLSGSCDLNPAHILRHVLLSPASGGSGDESEIDGSFAVAARQFAREGMGFSFFRKNSGDADAFRKKVERHANARCFRDRATGKWSIKLIRQDFNVGDLFVFDDSLIMDWVSPPVAPEQSELPNQVTLEYTRRDTGAATSVTLTNPAAVLARALAGRGGIVNHKAVYEGVTFDELANKICERELQAKTTPITTGSIRVKYAPIDLNVGSAFVINEPELQIDSMVCRVIELEETDGKDNSIVIRWAEDVFLQDLEQASFAVGDAVERPDQRPVASDLRFVEELPYFEVVKLLGEEEAALVFESDPDAGYWGATCAQPNPQHFSAEVTRFEATDFVTIGSTSFMPVWSLGSTLSAAADDTEIVVELTGQEDQIEIGELVQIGSELIRVDAIVASETTATFTVGRGCLDTVPQQHLPGARMYAWQEDFVTDTVRYLDGETVSVKVLPMTGLDTLGLLDAAQDDVLMASRAARPYAVGQFQVGGSYLLAGVVSGVLGGSWAHRDRLFQTTAFVEDHAADSIGPEPEVFYTPFYRFYSERAEWFAASDFFAQSDVFYDPDVYREAEFDADVGQALLVDFSADNFDFFSPTDVFAADDWFRFDWGLDLAYLGFGVRTYRGVLDPLASYQSPVIGALPAQPVADLSVLSSL